jgi:adenylosuccinate synthase
LKVCTDYNYYKGKIAHFPYNIEPENVTPVYKTLGWKADLTGMTTYEELPIELKEYIEFIEKK